MKYPTHSPEYRTVRCSWPTGLVRECPLCGAPVRFHHPDDGKLVHLLDETVYQVMNLYACTNPTCRLSSHPFNPNPRFDYGPRHYGADVFRFIAEEFLCVGAKPDQIHTRLTRHHAVDISPETVARISDGGDLDVLAG